MDDFAGYVGLTDPKTNPSGLRKREKLNYVSADHVSRRDQPIAASLSS
jgi:hypothetical protein